MKGVLIWLKGNPITVVAGLVILVSLGFCAWAWSSFGTLRDDLEAAAGEKRKLSNFGDNTVQLPAEAIDAPPLEVSGVTYNPPTVDRMRRIFSDLNNQTEFTISTFAGINQRGHQQLVEGFLPAVTGDSFNFKVRYRDAVATLLAGPGPAAGFAEANGVTLPTLKAGLPPEPESLQRRLLRIADEGARAFGDLLTEEQARSLRNEQKAALLEELTDRARALDVYAVSDIGTSSQFNSEFPLPVMKYVYLGTQPEPWQLWESQLQTWILQDIVAAIGLANGVEVPGIPPLSEAPTGTGKGVLGAAVKRLLAMEVLPGYVGLHTTGGVGSLEGTQSAGSGAASAAARPPLPVEGAITPGPGIPTLKPNYFISPTGRTSNSVFDVRHVRLRIHADYAKLPLFVEALARSNFMSVVDMKLTALDEYDYSASGLGGPFIYGVGEMVEADLVIETLWFRNWTTPLMPEPVREYLGVPNEDSLEAVEEAFQVSSLPNATPSGVYTPG